MSKNPQQLVTVLIPTFNRSSRLKIAIQSVQNQSYPHLKICIFDNNSTDNTYEVVNKLALDDSRIIYFKHKINMGMNANFNFAVKTVTTPYFCFLSDDDYYDVNFIESALSVFNSHQNVSFVCFEGSAINEESQELIHNSLEKWPREGLYQKEEATRLILDGNHFVISACLFKNELITEMHFDEKVSSISDLPVMLSLVTKYQFYLSKKVGMYFVRYRDSLGTKIDLLSWSNLDSYMLSLALPPKTLLLINQLLTPRINKLLLDHLLHYWFTKNEEYLSVKQIIQNRRQKNIILLKFYIKRTIRIIISLSLILKKVIRK